MLSRLASLARSPAPVPCPAVVAQGTVPRSSPRVKARRPVRVFRLVAEPLRPALVHAKALLALIAEQTPEAIGQWVLKSDLEIVYRQLAEREGWARLHWNRIGSQLGKLTRKRTVKRQGRRHVAYLVQLDAVGMKGRGR
jgi:hypothetical protein